MQTEHARQWFRDMETTTSTLRTATWYKKHWLPHQATQTTTGVRESFTTWEFQLASTNKTQSCSTRQKAHYNSICNPHPSELQPGGDYWNTEGIYWKRVHVQPRTAYYIPEQTDDGPDVSKLSTYWLTKIQPTHVILQSDQEDYLVALTKAVANTMGNITTRTSPAYSSQSQGGVERAHRTLFGQVRTLRAQIFQNYNRTIYKLLQQMAQRATHSTV